MNKPHSIIIVDDDLVNNAICSVLFMKLIDDSDIQTFNLPSEGFNFIVSEYSKTEYDLVVLFLDINMPEMTGWDFLERFEELDQTLKDKFKIYILSSSIDLTDKQRALDNKYVVDFLSKPITKDTILSIYKNEN